MGKDNSRITPTDGALAVGTPPGNDGNSFFTSSDFGAYFKPASDPGVEGAGTWDFSMGINGDSMTVPEPSSIALILAQGLTVGGFAALRRSRWTVWTK